VHSPRSRSVRKLIESAERAGNVDIASCEVTSQLPAPVASSEVISARREKSPWAIHGAVVNWKFWPSETSNWPSVVMERPLFSVVTWLIPISCES